MSARRKVLLSGLDHLDAVTRLLQRIRTAHPTQGLYQAAEVQFWLTTGVDLLAAAGAERISIGWEPENPASGHLYRSVGFEAVKRTNLFAGPVGAA